MKMHQHTMRHIRCAQTKMNDSNFIKNRYNSMVKCALMRARS